MSRGGAQNEGGREDKKMSKHLRRRDKSRACLFLSRDISLVCESKSLRCVA
jgi:hypothetical protein